MVPAPRRWSETLGGIRWLPRLVDKARLAQRGELGFYFLGHSPVDAELLRRLALTTDEFASIVSTCADDDAVLAALRARGYDEARLTRWSQRLPQRHPWILRAIDLDEGHAHPTLVERSAIVVLRATQPVWTAMVRSVLKVP